MRYGFEPGQKERRPAISAGRFSSSHFPYRLCATILDSESGLFSTDPNERDAALTLLVGFALMLVLDNASG